MLEVVNTKPDKFIGMKVFILIDIHFTFQFGALPRFLVNNCEGGITHSDVLSVISMIFPPKLSELDISIDVKIILVIIIHIFFVIWGLITIFFVGICFQLRGLLLSNFSPKDNIELNSICIEMFTRPSVLFHRDFGAFSNLCNIRIYYTYLFYKCFFHRFANAVASIFCHDGLSCARKMVLIIEFSRRNLFQAAQKIGHSK